MPKSLDGKDPLGLLRYYEVGIGDFRNVHSSPNFRSELVTL